MKNFKRENFKEILYGKTFPKTLGKNFVRKSFGIKTLHMRTWNINLGRKVFKAKLHGQTSMKLYGDTSHTKLKYKHDNSTMNYCNIQHTLY